MNNFLILISVKPHQDATYFHCDPIESVTGFWIPTEDATLENGCLYFIKGSHKKGLYSRLDISSPLHLQKNADINSIY